MVNLKHFKKTSINKHATTLTHKDGHKLTIAHSALSKQMRAKLDELPLEDHPSQNLTGKIEPKKPAEPQQPKKMASGGPVSTVDDSVPINTINPQIDSAADINSLVSSPNQSEDLGSKPYGLGETVYGTNGQIPINPQAPLPDALAAQAAPIPAAQAPIPSAKEPEAGPANMPVAPEPQNSDPYGTEAYLSSMNKGINEQKSGIMSEAAALGAQGEAESKVIQDNLKAQQENADQYKQHFGELESERGSFIKDYMNQHIDPNHYLNSMGALGKISTGIGLILGGMGSGVTGGENPAMKFLNQQIENDINAQKMELGKKENLLSANMKQFGNLRDAVDMTRVMQNDIVSAKLKQAAANAMTPMAKANALKAAGELDMKSAPILSQIALRKTLMSSMGGANGEQQDPNRIGAMIQAMRQVNPEMAKSMEERYVPGIGMSMTTPVPQAVRENLIAKQQLQNMATDFYSWAAKHSGSLDPRVVNEGKTKAAELQSLYRNSINGGVFKKGEQEFIDHIVDSDPTKFFNNIRVLPKLKEVINSNNAQLNVLKRGYGLPIAGGSPGSGPSGFQPKSFKPSK